MNNTKANVVFQFFPHLNRQAKSRILQLEDLYTFWNKQINVISRKDLPHLYIRHVLHSLSLSVVIKAPPFVSGQTVLDAGTGGGFPGIPLAIVHPDCHFILCDSIKKKIKVVEHVVRELKLHNVTPVVSRIEDLPERICGVVVSRAVTQLCGFLPWIRNKVAEEGRLMFLKGGDLSQEIAQAAAVCRIAEDNFTVTSLKDRFGSVGDGFFETKKICEIKQTSYLCAPLVKSS
ncbi:MAG: 16S rRNA (guanine(527)-N(7))-methyltransferase RsmG [Bacteroidales bacterium]|nr:16S rRNA (guanine(527)-N(7))-methyltransferase RsmG [Bacteroidales bacterium]